MANQDKAVYFESPNHIRRGLDEPFQKEIVMSGLDSIKIEFWFRFDPKQGKEMDRFFGFVSRTNKTDGFQYFFNYRDSTETISSGRKYYEVEHSTLNSAGFDFFEWTKVNIEIVFGTVAGMTHYVEFLKFNGVTH